MSLTTLTTKEVNDQIILDLESSLGETIPFLPKSFLRVLAKVFSGVFILLYKYAGFIALQQFVSTASYKVTVINGVSLIPLVEWGRLIGVGDPVSATYAELTITITVDKQVGTLQSGSQLIGDNNGVVYITIGDVNLDAPTVTATIKAVSDQAGGDGSGEVGNLILGDTLTFANPLANVNRSVTVASVIVTAADLEDLDTDYRQRVISRFQQRPQGGSYADYKAWGEETAGINNIYPYTGSNPGEVDIYAESSTETDGVPTTAQLQAVAKNIDYDINGVASRRPASVLTNVYAINRLTFDVDVIGLVVDNSAQVQADIQTEVEKYFLSKEPFITGLSIPPRNDRITQSELSGLVDDVVGLAGGVFGGVTIELNTVTTAIYVLTNGEKSKLGTMSFI